MIHANGQWKTKKALREAIAAGSVRSCHFTDPSIFGAKEFGDSPNVPVMGPSAYQRKWYAQVTFVDCKATKLS